MLQQYSFFSRPLSRFSQALALLLVAGAGLVGCKNETEAVPDQSLEYYPMQVGSYRVYDVVDSTFNNNVARVSRFQFKEEVAAEQMPDATGHQVYQVVRSRRTTPADAWKADSVFTVSTNLRNVVVVRNNVRTVELVFPVVEGKQWYTNSYNTYNELEQDSIAKLNRSYLRVGQDFTISSNGKAYSYPNTVTTMNDLTSDRIGTGVNQFYYTVLRNVYAQGVGPVYRARRNFFFCQRGDCLSIPGYIVLGQSRNEILVDSGK